MPAIPTPWLFTDERLGNRLFEAIEGVPPGGAVMFRHDAEPDRARLGAMVADAVRRRGLALGVAGDVALAMRLDADWVHGPVGPCDRPISLPVHDATEAARANDIGAALVFVSPIFPTDSHPGSIAFGTAEAAWLAQSCDAPAIALGGMGEDRFHDLPRGTFAGWAGIGAFLRPRER